MSVLRWYLVNDAESRREFALTGDVTERAEFGQIFSYLVEDNVFNLEGIANINSSGARDLMRFMRSACDAGKALTLQRCSPSFVSQLNMIAAFAGEAKVESVMAPFLCEECEFSIASCVVLAEDPLAAVGEERSCPECGSVMIFDDIEDHFFGFMQRGKR